MSKVVITGTIPTTRKKSGNPLALTDISQIILIRNGEQIDSVPGSSLSGSTFQFVDSSPLTGDDDYAVETITTDGFTSDPSNDAVVTIKEADPAASVTDLQASVQ